METITLGIIREMRDWYDGAKNPKAQEIANHVSIVAKNTPPDSLREELFIQGILFGYFLTTKGYIA